MRSRGLAVVLVLVLIAACAGAFAAWRVARSRLAGTSAGWEPPTVAVPEPTPPSTTSLTPTRTRQVETGPTVGPTQLSVTQTAESVAPTAISTKSTSPIDTATAPTVSLPTTASPTKMAPTATATRRAYGDYAFTQRRPVSHTKDGCPGKYILGMVMDSDGTPIAGVRVRAVDPWGNEAIAQSKSAAGEAGRYDIPLYPPAEVAVTYEVQVIDEHGNPMSATVEVAHGSGPSVDSCHWLDWQRVR